LRSPGAESPIVTRCSLHRLDQDLDGAYPGNDPPGYRLLLKPFLAVGNLDVVDRPCSNLLRAVKPWPWPVAVDVTPRRAPLDAALATAPNLLEGYQLRWSSHPCPTRGSRQVIVTGWQSCSVKTHSETAGDDSSRGFAMGASPTDPPVGEDSHSAGRYLPDRRHHRMEPPSSTNAANSCAPSPLAILAVSYRDDVAIKNFRGWRPYAQSTIEGGGGGGELVRRCRLPATKQVAVPDTS